MFRILFRLGKRFLVRVRPTPFRPRLETLEDRTLLSLPVLQVGSAEPYQTINQALTAYIAGNDSNALILVDPGTYNESVDFTGITLTFEPIGQVTIAGGLTFDNTDALAVNLSGTTPGTGYDQLNVAGTLSLNGATLEPALYLTPTAGNSFAIVTSDNLEGTFGNLPESGTISTDGFNFLGDYASGNVILTATPAAPSVQVSDDGGVFNGQAFGASTTISGIDGKSGSSLEGVTTEFDVFRRDQYKWYCFDSGSEQRRQLHGGRIVRRQYRLRQRDLDSQLHDHQGAADGAGQRQRRRF